MSVEPRDSVSQPYDPCKTPDDPETPAAELNRLRACLAKRQLDQKQAETGVQLVDSQIAALTQLVDDFEKIVADYTKDYDALLGDQLGFKDDYKHWEACLTNILEECAPDDIKKKAAALTCEIDMLREQIPKLEKCLVDHKFDRVEKEKERDKKKGVLEVWKKPSASIKARHGQLKTLNGDVKKAHDAKEFAYAFWILTDDWKFKGKLCDEPRVLSPAELRDELEESWKCYRKALADYNCADGRVKSTEKEIETKKARLDEATKKLDATLRSELSKIKPR